MNKFEMEIWADTKKMKQVLVYIVIITILAWVAHILGNIFWEKYTRVVTTLRGVRGEKGWPVTLYWWGMFIGIIGPISFIIVYVIMNKKEPSLALGKDALFINQQLIKQTLVSWKDISRVEKQTDGKITTLSIYFKDANKIISQQSGTRQTFLKENFKDGQPLKCDNRLSTGDFNAFAIKANQYITG
jgi:hypothetical protein